MHRRLVLETMESYLSRRRRVESKQLAKTQLPSFDNEIQLTAWPKLSTNSLHSEWRKALDKHPNWCNLNVAGIFLIKGNWPPDSHVKSPNSSINTSSNNFSFCQTNRHHAVLKCINDLRGSCASFSARLNNNKDFFFPYFPSMWINVMWNLKSTRKRAWKLTWMGSVLWDLQSHARTDWS